MPNLKPIVRPETWDLVGSLINVTRRMCLYGDPALGKTYLATHAGVEHEGTDNEDPIVYSVTLTEDSTSAELRGFFMPKQTDRGPEFVWQDGPVIQAWKQSHGRRVRLVVNEIDHASGDIFTFLMAVLDDLETARLTLPDNTTVRPGKGFFVVATMNGDPNQDLNDALKSRFPVRVKVEEPNPEIVKSLSKDLRSFAKKAMKLPKERRIDGRSWIEFDHLRAEIGDVNAAFAVFGDKAEDVLAQIRLAE